MDNENNTSNSTKECDMQDSKEDEEPDDSSDDDNTSVLDAMKPKDVPLTLLPPNHPLLEAFQKKLGLYLQNMKKSLLNEVEELKFQVKLKQQRREDEGVKLYDMQKEIQYQTDQIDDIVNDINNSVQERLKKEKEVNDLKIEFEKNESYTKDQKLFYNKRMIELQHIQTLDNNMRQWCNDVEDEVKNAKRMVNRDAQLQQQLSDDKRKSDMLFYHLDLEVQKKETELEVLREEWTNMRSVIEVLNMSISAANTDLEALQNEHKRLTQAWTEVIIAIQHRDKILYQVNDATKKENEYIKLANASIEAIKKQITKELTQNDKLENFKSRLANELQNLKRECQKQSDILVGLDKKLSDLPTFLHQTEKDLHEATREGNNLEVDIRRIQWRIDRQGYKKFQIEEGILKLAQEQLITDKASEYRLKLLRNAQDSRRTQELSLAQSQNQLSDILLEIEKYKSNLFKMKQDNISLKEKLSTVEHKFDNINLEMKSMQTQIDTKLVRIDKLSRQLDELIQASQGSEVSPTELKIKALEKTVTAAEHQIREHQQFWLMLQNHYVNLTRKRNNQLNEIQVTNKQLSVIKQKSLKIDLDLEKSEDNTRELNQEIQFFTSKVEILNGKIYDKRKHHEEEEQSCETEHIELLQKLKDNEMSVLALESEINELQVSIEHHKDIVLEKHREALSWETKYKLIEEAIHWHKNEQSKDSEISIMKTEIHRMNIRYSHLKKAQEKLIIDLNHCVMHREQFFEAVNTKQMAETKPEKMSSTTLANQKITDMRIKLKQVQNEITFINETELIDASNEFKRLRGEIQLLNIKLQQDSEEIESLQKNIEESGLLKHYNLENIIRKQNRSKSLKKLIGSSYALKPPKSESQIEQQIDKQMAINNSIYEVLQVIIGEYPDKKYIFLKLSQTLKIFN